MQNDVHHALKAGGMNLGRTCHRVRIENALSNDSQLSRDRPLVVVDAATALGDEDISLGKKSDRPRLSQPRHDDDAKVAVLRACRFDQERAVTKRRIGPVDRRRADVAFGCWNLGIDALWARGAAARSLTAPRALTGRTPSTLLRVEGDCCDTDNDDGYRDHRDTDAPDFVFFAKNFWRVSVTSRHWFDPARMHSWVAAQPRWDL
jgi:hypothetical protein